MLFRSYSILIFLALALSSRPASSQQQHQHPPPQKLGEVSFSISCSPSSQVLFNRAVALLHSFAYTDAQKQFVRISQHDPRCAMAHWGVAMSFYHQLWDPPLNPADIQPGLHEILTVFAHQTK